MGYGSWRPLSRANNLKHGMTLSPFRNFLRVTINGPIDQAIAATRFTVLSMAMVLNRSALSLWVETSRAKSHPMGWLNFNARRSIPWRFGGPGFDVFESYTGRALGAALLRG
jgi:hypothetical protein